MNDMLVNPDAIILYNLVVRALVVGFVLGFAGIATLIWK